MKKRIIILLLSAAAVYGQINTISSKSAITTPTDNTVFVVDYVYGGETHTRKITWANLKAAIEITSANLSSTIWAMLANEGTINGAIPDDSTTMWHIVGTDTSISVKCDPDGGITGSATGSGLKIIADGTSIVVTDDTLQIPATLLGYIMDAARVDLMDPDGDGKVSNFDDNADANGDGYIDKLGDYAVDYAELSITLRQMLDYAVGGGGALIEDWDDLPADIQDSIRVGSMVGAAGDLDDDHLLDRLDTNFDADGDGKIDRLDTNFDSDNDGQIDEYEDGSVHTEDLSTLIAYVTGSWEADVIKSYSVYYSICTIFGVYNAGGWPIANTYITGDTLYCVPADFGPKDTNVNSRVVMIRHGN
jgi:hypothetical protein